MQGARQLHKGPQRSGTGRRANLKALAESYGTCFRFPMAAQPHRMNDKETAAHAAAIATCGGSFQKTTLDKTRPSETREGRRQERRRDADQAGRCGEIAHERRQAGDRRSAATRRTGAKLQTFVDRAPERRRDEWQSVQASLRNFSRRSD
jgi:hypothetical protein